MYTVYTYICRYGLFGDSLCFISSFESEFCINHNIDSQELVNCYNLLHTSYSALVILSTLHVALILFGVSLSERECDVCRCCLYVYFGVSQSELHVHLCEIQ